MSRPTIEQLANVVFDEAYDNALSYKECEVLAMQIHALFSPPRKPLSELHKDEEACRKIVERFTTGKLIEIAQHPYGLWLIGSEGDISIKSNGNAVKSSHDSENFNVFDFVLYITSLGYEPVNSTDNAEKV